MRRDFIAVVSNAAIELRLAAPRHGRHGRTATVCEENVAMRKDIEFKTEDGIKLRGWHYLPEKRTGKVPTIVMAHGFSAVKEMYLDRFADAFAAAGLGALVFDNRNFGASDGEPRPEIDPWQQVSDYRDAIASIHITVASVF